MAATPLADLPDLEAVMQRSLTDDQGQRALQLLIRASSLFRVKAPWIDDRIADGTYDKVAVATVVAGVVKRVLLNPRGALSITTGPYSTALQSYRNPGVGNDGTLRVTDEDLAALAGPSRSRLGMMKLRPAMADRSGYGRVLDAEPDCLP